MTDMAVGAGISRQFLDGFCRNSTLTVLESSRMARLALNCNSSTMRRLTPDVNFKMIDRDPVVWGTRALRAESRVLSGAPRHGAI
jgi:hypothetical protein